MAWNGRFHNDPCQQHTFMVRGTGADSAPQPFHPTDPVPPSVGGSCIWDDQIDGFRVPEIRIDDSNRGERQGQKKVAWAVQNHRNKRLSMKPVSNRLMQVIIASLFILAVGLCGGAEVYRWRAHQLGEIPTGHNVGFEAGRYYMRQGPWDNRTTISRRQYTQFRENKRRAAALSLPGVCLGAFAVILLMIHGRRVPGKKPPAEDDLGQGAVC